MRAKLSIEVNFIRKKLKKWKSTSGINLLFFRFKTGKSNVIKTQDKFSTLLNIFVEIHLMTSEAFFAHNFM